MVLKCDTSGPLINIRCISDKDRKILVLASDWTNFLPFLYWCTAAILKAINKLSGLLKQLDTVF